MAPSLNFMRFLFSRCVLEKPGYILQDSEDISGNFASPADQSGVLCSLP